MNQYECEDYSRKKSEKPYGLERPKRSLTNYSSLKEKSALMHVLLDKGVRQNRYTRLLETLVE